MASILFRTVLVYLLLTLVLKIMGKRQIGELEVSELVSTLLISEIASLPIDDPDIPLLNAVIPILFILCMEIILSSLKNKLPLLKKWVEGKPVYLIYRGKLRQKVLDENRISINELLSEMRLQGIADIQDVAYAVLEQSGKISMIQKASENGESGGGGSAPAGMADTLGSGNAAGKAAQGDRGIAHCIIIDREVEQGALRALGYDEAWLRRALAENHTTREEVFLMTVNDLGEINIINKDEKA